MSLHGNANKDGAGRDIMTRVHKVRGALIALENVWHSQEIKSDGSNSSK